MNDWLPKVLVLAGYGLLALWVLFRPRRECLPPGREDAGIAADLRAWALAALGMQILIYLFLG